jgi:PEP-CTERM/exosortase A-associated glycosyltransferase
VKVLHVLDHSVPLFSGYSFRSQSIIHFQQALGITPVVLTSPKQGSLNDEIEKREGIPYYRTGRSGDGLTTRLPVARELDLISRLARRIAHVVRSEKIDLIHSHSPLLNGLPALWVARRGKIPMVYEARAFWEDAAVDHGTTREGSLRYRSTRSLETFLFRCADRVVTICEAMRAELTGRGVAADKVEVVPNGVDAEWFTPQPKSAALARELGLNGGPVFGFIGSFYHYEGLRFLVNAFAEIQRQIPAARLLLVGGGAEEARLKEMAGEVKTGVVFAGQIPHERIRDYYSVIDICVFPRISMRLTNLVTPLKPLEAMAMGKAVLASDVGGHKELIRDGANGLLFPSSRPADFCAQAVRLANDRELRAALGEGGRRYVVNERSWERLVRRYVELYEEMRSAQN